MNPPPNPALPPPAPPPAPPVFGVNEMRLGPREWLATVFLLVLIALLVPRIWTRVERFETGPDYRLPYALSRDYWLYARRLAGIEDPRAVAVVGDSVVWGEYVQPDGTLSHFLNREAGTTRRFLNAGVNGMFPLALEGLMADYGGALAGRRVIVQCNFLWMSSPKADLSTEKEESFNHARLVPQFSPRIPCYRADASERLGALVERNVGFLQWAGHLESAYFGQKGIVGWTLADDGGDPPRYPNLFLNPLRQITLVVPQADPRDPERGPASPRHRSWTNGGGGKPVEFEWVDPKASLQWPAFQRLVRRLRERGADVFVLVGPFNEHMVGAGGRERFGRLKDAAAAWLTDESIPHAVPAPLPSELYADASHPLTEGYALLAKGLWEASALRDWLGRDGP